LGRMRSVALIFVSLFYFFENEKADDGDHGESDKSFHGVLKLFGQVLQRGLHFYK